MAITLRAVKGSALTIAEADGNIIDLDGRVTTMEENPPAPYQIVSITQPVPGSSTMTVALSNGDMYTLTLPVVAFNWRGTWAPATTYNAPDVFEVPTVGIFLVDHDHVSGPSFDPDEEDSDGPLYIQMFGTAAGSVIDTLDDVGDVEYQDPDEGPADGAVLRWVGGSDGHWEDGEINDGVAYDFGCSFEEEPEANTVIGRVIMGRDCIMDPDLVGTKKSVETLPASDYVVTVYLNNSPIGEVLIDSGGIHQSYGTSSDFDGELLSGDVIKFVAPENESDGPTGISGLAIVIPARIATGL